jgi:hypothetical protein
MTFWEFADKHADGLGALFVAALPVIVAFALMAFVAWLTRGDAQ